MHRPGLSDNLRSPSGVVAFVTEPSHAETEVGCLRINEMRAQFPIATGTWYHVMSFDITQCHERSIPGMSQTDNLKAGVHTIVSRGLRAGGASAQWQHLPTPADVRFWVTCRLISLAHRHRS
jgi:hypothetical protein